MNNILVDFSSGLTFWFFCVKTKEQLRVITLSNPAELRDCVKTKEQ